MSWLSKATGININLNREAKKIAQKAFDDYKPEIITVIQEISAELKKQTNLTDTGIRTALHSAVNKIGLPIYVSFAIGLVIDTFSLDRATKQATTLQGRITIETERIIKQIQGARL
jgi:hypothetical protein